ncbi:GntR family transcriptional regulator [Streptomyces sp. NPDC048409]|uniref:GntR family transcriptional regulator n=1 Tax=Streptomyces sp. NPDC048409 TaxID=3154723 RepID=UPI00344378B3
MIAGDLAIAIYQGAVRDGERLPSQARLARSYGVSSGTAAAALALLAAAGLIRTAPGSGTFAISPSSGITPNPVFDVMDAASVCRSIASLDSGSDDRNPPTVHIGGSRFWGTV